MEEKLKILIVDDKPENLYALEVILRDLDVELIKAGSGNEALAATLNHNFSLAILDVQMPEMDGYELAEIMRHEEKTRDMPIIFVSAIFSDDFHIFQGYEAGAVDFIPKPFDKNLLLSKVRVFIQLAEARKISEDKARQAEIAGKHKSDFLAHMSHELRSSLNSILLLSELFSENREGNFTIKQVEMARTIHSSGNDMLNLVDGVLDLAKIESGKMEINQADESLKQIKENMEKDFEYLARNKGLKFAVNIEEGLPEHICTDLSKLEKIIRNFLSNSFKFTSEGSVTLFVGRPTDQTDLAQLGLSGLNPEDAIAFSVFDTGIGIPDDRQRVIFEAYRQADETICQNYGGTGLGLPIAKKLAKLLKGDIHLKSKEGEGSTITLYLPAANPNDQKGKEEREKSIIPGNDKQILISSRQPKQSPQVLKAELKNKSVLVVDDDMNSISTFMVLFEEYAMKVQIAKTGKECLKCLAGNPDIDIVLMDIMMPVMDGYEAIRQIRKQGRFKDLPIIAVTAKAMAEDREKCLGAGASDYLSKPVNEVKLFSMMKDWLQICSKVTVSTHDLVL